MIKYLYMHLFYSKKRFILVSAMILFILMMTLLVFTDESIVEQRLYQAENQIYYESMMRKLLTMLCPFFVILLSMDHDQQHLKPLFGYFGRMKITIYKLIFHILVLIWLYLILLMLYHILPFFLTHYYEIDTHAIYFFEHLFLDGMIIVLFTFIFIRDKHKALSVIIPVFYIVLSFIEEDHPSLILFYLFPVYSSYFYTLTLAYIYKICYICLGLIIILIQMLYEAI